eukprot:Pgem_evm1s7933
MTIYICIFDFNLAPEGWSQKSKSCELNDETTAIKLGQGPNYCNQTTTNKMNSSNVVFDIDDTLMVTHSFACINSTIEIMKDYYEQGKTIFLLTARSQHSYLEGLEPTLRQLTNCGIDQFVNLDTNLYFTDHTTKVPYLSHPKIAGSVFYDDNYNKNIIDVVSAAEEGIIDPNMKLVHITKVGRN